MVSKKYKVILKILCFVIVGVIIIFFCFKYEKEHILKRYYPDSKETYQMGYTIRNGDTILQGRFVTHNEKGIKIAEGNFVNGQIKGKSIYYYDNGKIKSIYYKKDSKTTKEATEYYPNGKVKRYVMFDPFGLEAFIARYDEQGNIKSYEGYPLMEIYQYPIAHKERFNIKTNQYLKVGDTLKHNYLVANIPNAKRSLDIELLGVDNSKIRRVIKQNPPIAIEVKEILTKKGKNTIRAVTQYKFKDNVTPTIKDTTFFDIEVH